MTRFNKPCTALPLIKEKKQVRVKENVNWITNKKVNCFNVLPCNKTNCNAKYIRKTGRIVKFRLEERRGYITKKDESQPTGIYFNLPGHSLANFKVTVIEQVIYDEEEYHKEWEHYYINEFNPYRNGMHMKIDGDIGRPLLIYYIVPVFIKKKHEIFSEVFNPRIKVEVKQLIIGNYQDNTNI